VAIAHLARIAGHLKHPAERTGGAKENAELQSILGRQKRAEQSAWLVVVLALISVVLAVLERPTLEAIERGDDELKGKRTRRDAEFQRLQQKG
jgi:hypothetical protein